MLKCLKLAWELVFPDTHHALLKENSQLRDKLRQTRRYLRDANRGAEWNSLLARHGSHQSKRQCAEIAEQRAKIDALTQALAEERAKNGVQPVTQ